MWILIVLWMNGSQTIVSYPSQFECTQARMNVELNVQVDRAMCVRGGL